MCGVRVCVGWDDGWLLSFGTGIAPDATCSMTCAIGVLSLAVPEDALQSASSERLTRVTTSGDVGVVCVRLWDVATGANTKTLEGHSGVVRSVAFSAVLRCRLVAVMCVGCWLWVGCLLLFVCDGSGCGVQDGKTIASGSGDKSIRCVCVCCRVVV